MIVGGTLARRDRRHRVLLRDRPGRRQRRDARARVADRAGDQLAQPEDHDLRRLDAPLASAGNAADWGDGIIANARRIVPGRALHRGRHRGDERRLLRRRLRLAAHLPGDHRRGRPGPPPSRPRRPSRRQPCRRPPRRRTRAAHLADDHPADAAAQPVPTPPIPHGPLRAGQRRGACRRPRHRHGPRSSTA